MKLRRPIAAIATAFALGPCLAAHADATVTISSTFDSPQLRQMFQNAPAEQRKAMLSQGYGKAQTSVTYIHGSMLRRDEGGRSTIIDTKQHTALLLDRDSHTYLTAPFFPKPPPPQVEKPSATVTDTGVTKKFLGHTVRIYKLSISAPKAKSSLQEEIWAASDIPPAPYDPLLNNPTSPIADKVGKIKGYPLKIVVHATTAASVTTVTETATAVSTKPLSPSLFKVPSGYKKFTPPAPPTPPTLVPKK